MSYPERIPAHYPRAALFAAETQAKSSSHQLDVRQSDPCPANNEGRGPPQRGVGNVVVYMNGQQEELWKWWARSLEAKRDAGLLEWLNMMPPDHYAECLGEFNTSGLRDVCEVVRDFASTPVRITWLSYVHLSVVGAVQSRGMSAPSSFQATVLKSFSELLSLGEIQGLLIQGPPKSGKSTLLLVIALSTAIEANERIALEDRKARSTHAKFGEYSPRTDGSAASPVVIIITPTDVCADRICRAMKKLAASGRMEVYVKVYRKLQDKQKRWDYISEHNGRCFLRCRQVDIAVCTLPALNDWICSQRLSIRDTQLIMFDDGETLFGRSRLTTSEGCIERALKQVVPKMAEESGKLSMSDNQMSKTFDVDLIPLQLMAKPGHVRVVMSCLDDVSPALTNYMIEKVFEPFKHPNSVHVTGVQWASSQDHADGADEGARQRDVDGLRSERDDRDGNHISSALEKDIENKCGVFADEEEGGVDIRAWL